MRNQGNNLPGNEVSLKFMRVGQKEYSAPVDAFSEKKNERNKIHHG